MLLYHLLTSDRTLITWNTFCLPVQLHIDVIIIRNKCMWMKLLFVTKCKMNNIKKTTCKHNLVSVYSPSCSMKGPFMLFLWCLSPEHHGAKVTEKSHSFGIMTAHASSIQFSLWMPSYRSCMQSGQSPACCETCSCCAYPMKLSQWKTHCIWNRENISFPLAFWPL